MSWYRTGKISVVNGSKAVDGLGTDFVTSIRAGFALNGPDGAVYEVQSVAGATSLTLVTAYQGPSAVGAAYSIVQTQSIIAELAAQAAALLNGFESSKMDATAAAAAAAAAVAAAGASASDCAIAKAAAAASAQSAGASAVAATGQSANAAASAGTAIGKAADAAASATAASAAFSAFGARYLGPKAVAPATDNDGNALVPGTLYFDTVMNGGCMRVRQAGAWITLPGARASEVTTISAGGLSATNVQAALNELDSEKASITALATFAGAASIGNAPAGNIAATTVQGALNELDSEKAALNGAATQDFNVASINGGALGGMENRIINGDFRVNQYNLSSATTPVASSYVIDRWCLNQAIAGKFSAGLNQYAWTPPPGLPAYLAFGAQGAYTPGAGEYFMTQQLIEGYNLQDIAYGSTGAKSCVLSMWVRASLAGTHSGAIYNLLANKSFAFTFAIPVANVWTLVKVTIPGDTAAAAATNHTAALQVRFNLGAGSNFLQASDGTWKAGSAVGATGAVSVVASNASFGITGVAFRVGNYAAGAPRAIQDERVLCQQYYEFGPASQTWSGNVTATATYYLSVRFSVPKRWNPTVILTDNSSSNFPTGAPSLNNYSAYDFIAQKTASASGPGYFQFAWTASAEL